MHFKSQKLNIKPKKLYFFIIITYQPISWSNSNDDILINHDFPVDVCHSYSELLLH